MCLGISVLCVLGSLCCMLGSRHDRRLFVCILKPAKYGNTTYSFVLQSVSPLVYSNPIFIMTHTLLTNMGRGVIDEEGYFIFYG